MIGRMEDDPLLTDLADLLRRIDPVPPEVTLAARSAFAWRTLDDELVRRGRIHVAAGSREPGVKLPAELFVEFEAVSSGDRLGGARQVLPISSRDTPR